MTNTQVQNIREAIRIAGSQRELAFRCHVSQQTISKWLCNHVDKLRFEHALAIDKATGGKVTWQQLLPTNQVRHA